MADSAATLPGWALFALALLLGPILWLIGAIVFDVVHCVLHAMLRSRFGVLRRLAWPHSVHHAWIDRQLQVQWHLQRRNIACHLVPEYLTQLVFTAGVAAVLSWPFAAVLGALQTVVFLGLLSQGGLDPNHRQIELLDAYRPGPWTPPAYHALHHVHPNAYYSAYTKLVDALVGSATELRGRRFVLCGGAGRLAAALEEALRAQGVTQIELLPQGSAAQGPAVLAPLDPETLDVLVVCDPDADRVALVEAFVAATRLRRIPAEVWACHPRDDDPIGRYYQHDVRLHYRTIVVPDGEPTSPAAARRAARRVVARVRRGFHYVHTGSVLEAWRGLRRFRATAPEQPPRARRLRHRTDARSDASPAATKASVAIG